MTFNFDKVPLPNNWTIAIFCLILLLLTFQITQYRKKIIILGKSLFLQRYFSLMLRESKVIGEFFAFLLWLFSLFTYAFGVTILLERYYPALVTKLTLIGCWSAAVVVLLSLYVIKLLCNKAYGALFEHEKEVSAMRLLKLAFLADSSALLLPIIAVVTFTHTFEWLYVFIPLFICLSIIWLFKLLKINPRKINLFHFFVYFCTLEILPYIVLMRLIASI